MSDHERRMERIEEKQTMTAMTRNAAYGLASLSVLVVLVCAATIGLYEQNRAQDSHVARLQADLARERQSQSDREYAGCIASITSVSIANQVIQSIRDIADGLAVATSDQLQNEIRVGARPASLALRHKALNRWRKIRTNLTLFPSPHCIRNGP